MGEGGKVYINQSVETTVFYHVPRILGCGDVGFSIQCDMTESIAVEELGKPIKEGDQTSQETEYRVANGTFDSTFLARLAPCNRAQVSQELDDSDNQTPKADGAKTIGKGPIRGTTGRILWEVVRVEIPRAVDAGYGCVDGVFKPLGHPVHGECNKDDQPNDPGMAAASVSAGWVAGGGLEFGIDGHQGDSIICPECSGH